MIERDELGCFSRTNLLCSLVWIAPKLEKILSIEAELDRRWSSIMARSHRPGFTPLHVFLTQVYHTPGFSTPTELSWNNDLRNDLCCWRHSSVSLTQASHASAILVWSDCRWSRACATGVGLFLGFAIESNVVDDVADSLFDKQTSSTNHRTDQLV